MAWQEEEEEDVETSTQGEKIENFRTEGRKKCVFFQEGSKKSLSPSVSSSSSSYNVNRYIYIYFRIFNNNDSSYYNCNG